MKFFFRFVILLTLFLSGCSENEDIAKEGEVNSPQPSETNELPQKTAKESFHPLIVNDSSFIEVIDWYDDKSILYLTDENGKSHIKRYDVVTKEEEDFFSIDEPITSVIASIDRSRFAVQTASYTGDSPLYITDRDGNVEFKKDKLGEAFSLFWNPYDEKQLLLVSFLPNWEFKVFLLSLETKELKSVSVTHTFFQWLDKQEIAYLNWEIDEPSFQAPVHLFNLNSGEETKLHDNIIGMFSFSDHVYFTVNVDSKYDLMSKYTFYKNFQKVSEIEVPILNTYSEQWWVPFNDFDRESERFYYLAPYDSADFFEYNDGFLLTAFNIKTGEKTNIIELQEHAPIKLSPDGSRLLYGNQLQFIVDLKTKELSPLVEYRLTSE